MSLRHTRALAAALALATSVPLVVEARDPAVARDCQRANPCPATGKTSGACPGWVRDHVVALCKGGPDSVANMQWQTVEEAKAKDKWECR